MSKPVLGRSRTVLGWICFLALIGGWIVIRFLGDRVWWALPVLYGPRWPWLLLLPGLVPYFALAPRRRWLLLVAGVGVAVFGIVGWRVGLGRLFPASGTAIRVMTLNANGGRAPASRIIAEIDRLQPDVVVITECTGPLPEALNGIPGHFSLRVARLAANCLLTKGAIMGWGERAPGDAPRRNGSAAIERAEIQLPQGSIHVGMVHLATPRYALEDFLDRSRFRDLRQLTEASTTERQEESENAAGWLTQQAGTALLIGGDFNLPVESAIYRRNWSGFRNAFSEVGWGPGYTKHTRFWGIRIDHVLSSPDIHPVRSFTGRDVGSDHVPMVADLLLPAQRTSTAR